LTLLTENMFQSEILSSTQVEIISKLGFLRKENIYLAGGAALAIQMGHRTSVDLDFFSEQGPDMQKIVAELQRNIKGIIIRRATEKTLFAEARNTDISLFHYPYRLLGSFVESESLYLASMEDIAAMKVAAIIQRGTMRDFIDMYYLLGKYNLRQILGFTKKKFPGYQDVMALKALLFFEDARKEKTGRAIKVFDKSYSWDEVEKEIFRQVKNYQLAMIEGKL